MRLRPLLLCLLLGCVTAPACAAEAQQLAGEPGVACPEGSGAGGATARLEDVEDDDDAAPARRATKAKAATAAPRNGGGSNRGTTPRWHSFLPGMIR